MPFSPLTARRASIDGAAFEKLVCEMLSRAGAGLQDFQIASREQIQAPDGEYQIDITVRFRQLGVDFLVLVECKDHSRRVEREYVQVLADRMRSAGAQKGILFSTNGFQSGALDYARAHGIALVRVVDGELTYETRSTSVGAPRRLPSWLHVEPFAVYWLSAVDGVVVGSHIEREHPGAITAWLTRNDSF